MAFIPTEDQQRVIDHDIGRHGRVLAGPGTGKSSTAVALAERLATLDPKPRVRFLTFTRAATAELTKKVRDAGQSSTMPSTIHSFAISVLLKNDGAAPIPHPLRIADKWEQETLIEPHLTSILKDAAPFRVVQKDVDALLREMAAKWESLDPARQDEKIPDELRNLFVAVFNAHRWRFGYTLLSELPDLLRGVLESYENVDGVGYDLMIVDEYQDLNACDLEVLRLVAERGPRILAVGDDDQSIYSFRIAHPEGIRRFPQDYQGAEEYALTFCHRLNKQIGDWAQFVIGGDQARAARANPDYADDAPQGHVALLSFPTSEEEAAGVVAIVKHLVEKHDVHPSEIALLFRTDSHRRFSGPIQEGLEAAGIPTVDSQKSDRLLAEAGTRKLLALLQLLINPKDSLAWWALMHLEPGIGNGTVDLLFSLAQERGTTFGEALVSEAPGFTALPKTASNKLANLYQETTARMDEVFQVLPQESNEWGAVVAEMVAGGRLPQCSGDLLSAVAATDDPDEDPVSFKEFVTRFGLRLKEQVEADQSGVRCMTMMSSKGLTVRATVVVGVEDEFIPRDGQDANEETRLLYVAMTRSKEHLFLTFAQQRQGNQAHAGRANFGNRHPSRLLINGPVRATRGNAFVARM